MIYWELLREVWLTQKAALVNFPLPLPFLSDHTVTANVAMQLNAKHLINAIVKGRYRFLTPVPMFTCPQATALTLSVQNHPIKPKFKPFKHHSLSKKK